jgi:O-antigen/teichoic acid export membrane protein
MAKAGFGVWALVAQYLSNTTIDTIVLLMTVSWRPHLTFSKKSAIELMNFGWKMVLANLVNAIYNELRSIIIGRSYSSADLAYYNKGNQIPSLAITNIDTAIGNVIFPAMSTAESPEKLKTIGRRAMKTTSYIIFPIMVGLIVVSRPLITLLLTKKWDSSIIYMQILCIYWMTQPIQTTNWQIIKAMGRSDLCLKLELLKKAIGIIMVVAAMFISVKAIAISAAVFGVISMIINILPNKKLINYSIIEQMLDIIPALGISIVMGVIVYLCSYMTLPTIVILIIQVIVGVTIYVCLSYILRLDSYMYLIGVVKNRRK